MQVYATTTDLAREKYSSSTRILANLQSCAPLTWRGTTRVRQCVPQIVSAPRGGHVISISNGGHMISVWNLVALLLLSFLVFACHMISHMTGTFEPASRCWPSSVAPLSWGGCWVRLDSGGGEFTFWKKKMPAAYHNCGGSKDHNSASISGVEGGRDGLILKGKQSGAMGNS